MLLTKAFTVYVRPMLEHCSPVWSPCHIGNINKLESVQRRRGRSRTLTQEGQHPLTGQRNQLPFEWYQYIGRG